MGSDAEVPIAARIRSIDKKMLEKVVEDDIKITSVGHLIRVIIAEWADTQRAHPNKGESQHA